MRWVGVRVRVSVRVCGISVLPTIVYCHFVRCPLLVTSWMGVEVGMRRGTLLRDVSSTLLEAESRREPEQPQLLF